VIEYSANGALLQRDGNRGPAAAPQNFYQTAGIDEFGRDDCWVAIAVATDEQWGSLRVALGDPSWAADPALADAAGRRARHDLIDQELSGWCATRSADDVVETLWNADVPVAKVMQPHRQTELAQLAERGFFEQVDHPVNGPAPHSTLPARMSQRPHRTHTRHAPLLGQHNHELLSELGLSETEIAALAADGVIGSSPG
jgi:crotonobetainyl-CoA:carnitine CoA-transferase CaiB-like acyl-CoA transferase